MHPNAVRIQALLRQAGATGEVREVDGSARTAADAAASLGCEVAAIANSLVFLADGNAILVLTSGAHRVDPVLVAQRIGVGTMSRADPQQVRAATGQPIGAVSPVGHPRQLRVLIDSELRAHSTIWAAAGTPHTVFPTTFEELARITHAEEVTVA
ncbi:MAG: YbaK/prolyl-tRNA synthetase associated region [Acidimicrobiaceae bacterium]|nr:YbaK/prolyl-tRNA synthetase associated region [Acidimicrobiaceae bacterium]